MLGWWLSEQAPPNHTSATIPETQEIEEKTDRTLNQFPDQWDWSLEVGTHGRLKKFKAVGPLVRFSNHMGKVPPYMG